MTVKGDFEVIAKGAFADEGRITETYTVRVSSAWATEWAMAWDIYTGSIGHSRERLEDWENRLSEAVTGSPNGQVSRCACLFSNIYLVAYIPKREGGYYGK